VISAELLDTVYQKNAGLLAMFAEEPWSHCYCPTCILKRDMWAVERQYGTGDPLSVYRLARVTWRLPHESH
jgi:hypothetical protein